MYGRVGSVSRPFNPSQSSNYDSYSADEFNLDTYTRFPTWDNRDMVCSIHGRHRLDHHTFTRAAVFFHRDSHTPHPEMPASTAEDVDGRFQTHRPPHSQQTHPSVAPTNQDANIQTPAAAGGIQIAWFPIGSIESNAVRG